MGLVASHSVGVQIVAGPKRRWQASSWGTAPSHPGGEKQALVNCVEVCRVSVIVREQACRWHTLTGRPFRLEASTAARPIAVACSL